MKQGTSRDVRPQLSLRQVERVIRSARFAVTDYPRFQAAMGGDCHTKTNAKSIACAQRAIG
jgi:hypothetical protein